LATAATEIVRRRGDTATGGQGDKVTG
jgi:hypothetical protein